MGWNDGAVEVMVDVAVSFPISIEIAVEATELMPAPVSVTSNTIVGFLVPVMLSSAGERHQTQ